MESVLPLIIGFALDLCLGDPSWLPHPVAWIGKGVSYLEETLRRSATASRYRDSLNGLLLVVVVVMGVYYAAAIVAAIAGSIHPYVGVAVESYLVFQLLAVRGLRDAGVKVYRRLVRFDLPGARAALAEIVSRDTGSLDQDGVARAAVESIAENASDGAVAPMFFYAVGGLPLLAAYKAINTLDSMVGYKNVRYRDFGRIAALLDDIANFIPARLTGLFFVAAAFPIRYDWRESWRIFRRDRKKHSSPNAGHPEAAVAGALGVRLGGPSFYGGLLVQKPWIGDPKRSIEAEDIVRTNRLLYAASALALLVFVWVRLRYG